MDRTVLERMVAETRTNHEQVAAHVCDLAFRVDEAEHAIREASDAAEGAAGMAALANQRLDELAKGPEEPKPHGMPWDMPKRILRTVPKANARRPHPRRGTVCLWDDGTVTHAEPSAGTPYDPFTGLAVCLLKRLVALDPTARERGHRAIVADASMGNRATGLTYGIDSDSSYRLAVMAAGSGLYARMLPRALSDRYSPYCKWPEELSRTFFEYVRAVMDHEAEGIAKRMADDFERRLRQVRKEAAIRAWNERHRRELEERRAIVRKEAESNGASAFEAWKYAMETVPVRRRPPMGGSIAERERDSIRLQALAEARCQIDGMREVVTFDVAPTAPAL